METLTRRFVEAQTDVDHDGIVLEIHRRVCEMVPCIPLGTFQIRSAYRGNLTGVIEATGPNFWSVRRV